MDIILEEMNSLTPKLKLASDDESAEGEISFLDVLWNMLEIKKKFNGVLNLQVLVYYRALILLRQLGTKKV